eukprot:SAG31_NODE_2143_length_6342_cov_5.402531_4_plen_141_part_00
MRTVPCTVPCTPSAGRTAAGGAAAVRKKTQGGAEGDELKDNDLTMEVDQMLTDWDDENEDADSEDAAAQPLQKNDRAALKDAEEPQKKVSGSDTYDATTSFLNSVTRDMMRSATAANPTKRSGEEAAAAADLGGNSQITY